MNSAKKKLDDSCVPPNLPFNITNKTNKQTNTTKYKTKKWLYKITTYVWWFQAFAITMQLQISLNLLLVHAANIYIVEFETQ